MTRSWNSMAVLVFSWILWQHVVDLKSQSERWITQTTYPTQQLCRRDGPRIIDQLRSDILRRGLRALYILDEGIGGFFVEDKEKYVFMCYSSDFDPRPRT